MGVNRFDDLCDRLDAAVFNGDWLFEEKNRSIFEEYLRRWDTELRSHGAASENNSDYAALLARHNALKEAVAWERECCQDIRPLVAWARLYVLHGEDYVDAVAEALREIQDAARAEVDRLIANEMTADCKGEG